MILSDRHKFVFIKGMKVAGTSVEMALSTLCGPHDIVTPISPVDEQARLRGGGLCQNYSSDATQEADYRERILAAATDQLAAIAHPTLRFFNHMALADVVARYGKPLSDFRIVCIERSPYAKVISWANMRLTYGLYRAGGEMRAEPEALRAYIDKGLESGAIVDVRNIDRYRWPDGRLAAEPMRYADLRGNFDAFVRSLGATDIPPLPHAKKGLLSDTLRPQEILRADQIHRINELFAEEFDAFDYPKI